MRARSGQVLFLIVIGSGWLATACHDRSSSAPAEAGIQEPLSSFRQVLTSSVSSLTLHPEQETTVPVRIQNPGQELWVSTGKYPVTISYKWYRGGKMLLIEGERTLLPAPLGPGQTADAAVRVVAPPDAGQYRLRISLVQEAVTWFMLKSNMYLELPAAVQ